MNRTTYDACTYKQDLNQSVAPLSYVLDPIKYTHCNKCRVELGVVGGTAVSHVSGNQVDLESDLRGQNRPLTQCPEYKWVPPSGDSVQGKEYIKPVQHPPIDTRMVHLPPCQMVQFGAVPPTPPLDQYKCPK